MKSFEPIAIVGLGCVFPDAYSPDSLWEGLLANRSYITDADEGTFRIARKWAERDEAGRLWPVKGGYIRGFEDDRASKEQDPILRWTLASAKQALEGVKRSGMPAGRQGLIMGNLSLPTRSFSQYAESVWMKEMPWLFQPEEGWSADDPLHRMMSGFPSHYVAEQLGLRGAAYALDAACASSLYAMKLACDRLQLGKADLMLAGAVNGTDPLFLHIGFRALQAMSPTGQSRPFHPEADGLVPAEGAGFVALKRLSDAEAGGDRIYAVIRGIGLSNDGGAGSLMAPSASGQKAAMAKAYEMAGISPASVSYVECHATGTPVGDTIELESMKDIYAGAEGLRIGSMKSNTGHLMTASGMASVIKVVKGMEHGVIPATLHMEEGAAPLAALENAPFRIASRNESWAPAKGTRIAAVNSFGFGGNNAHLILEQYEGRRGTKRTGKRRNSAQSIVQPQGETVAVIGIGIVTGRSRGTEAFIDLMSAGGMDGTGVPSEQLQLWGDRFSFPPKDLQKALPQQLQMMSAVHEALADIRELPAERTGFYVGMQCDSEIARHIARVRLQQWAEEWERREGQAGKAYEWLEQLRNGFADRLDGATVLGLLPNIPANRFNKHYQATGPSFTLSSEELSGIRALETAITALQLQELDAAVVGAVDLSAEPVQIEALRALYGEALETGDASVALVMKRLSDAEAAGDPILAVLQMTDRTGAAEAAGPAKEDTPVVGTVGYAHAASGLLEVTGSILTCALNRRLGEPYGGPVGKGGVTLDIHALGGQSAAVHVAPYFSIKQVKLARFHGGTREELIRSLRESKPLSEGPERVIITADNPLMLQARVKQALQWLETHPDASHFNGVGFSYRSKPVQGELGLVYTGAAAAYGGMGAGWFEAFPEAYERTAERFGQAMKHVAWIQTEEKTAVPFEKLCATSFLCQFHTELSRKALKVKPDAVIGLSSGETNTLIAWGAWDCAEGLFQALEAEDVYTRWLAGNQEILADQWGSGFARWVNWRVLHPVALVEQAVAEEPRAAITMIHTDNDCVIGGHPEACRQLIEKLGKVTAIPVDYDMVIHTPECEPFSEQWRKIHRRPTQPVDSVRFYTCSTYSSYTPDEETTADALLQMAIRPIDFRRLIRKAYEDGVRVFIEHGPRNVCGGWIKDILGDRDREYAVISLDQPGRPFAEQWGSILAQLVAAGVPIDSQLYEEIMMKEKSMKPLLTVPAHPKQVTLPDLAPIAQAQHQHMPEAPSLPEVLGLYNQGQTLEAAAPQLAAAAVEAPQHNHQPKLAELQAVYQQISQVHHRYLQQMSGAFQRYIHVMSQQLALGPNVGAGTVRGAGTAAGGGAANKHQRPGVIQQEPQQQTGNLSSVTPLQPSPRPSFSRQQLEQLASGSISEVFGPLFRVQDPYPIQVRMPEPPLLLADRVTGIDGEPGVLGKGAIWTETDVTAEAWYLHQGRMPFGILVESGQADLLLVSWQGIDFLNQGKRMYRLLGCELTFFGPLPQPGETLCYEIHIDGHAQLGDTRIFFFHYDLYVNGECRMSMRHGQAGFFSKEELDSSKGVLWEPETAEYLADARVDVPLVVPAHYSFTREQLVAFSEGKLSACFGPGYRHADTHVRSPRIQGGDMLLLQRVVRFDPHGGPWKRGYLHAETFLQGDEWFFPCHFKGDPAMPGTLMLEGCIQAMTFYMAGLGYTLDRDGWRFEPSTGDLFKMVCRGQITPQSRHLKYEVFVEEVWDGPIPTLYADVLLTVDGLKAFHCRRMGLKLLPDWPLDEKPKLLAEARKQDGGYEHNGFTFDYASLLACAWGRPSEAFGPRYTGFDGIRRLPRLPGPPYHFMSRIHHIEGDLEQRKDVIIEADYHIPQDDWYFSSNGTPVMPVCVLMEAALQPCGWLTALVGIPLSSDIDLSFRNLDGRGTMYKALIPGGSPLRTRVKLLSVSRMGNTYIEAFDVQCTQDGEPVFDMYTVFGHFPQGDLAKQAGLPAADEELRLLGEPNTEIDLMDREDGQQGQYGLLPAAPLLMIDRISGYWPQGGVHQRGCVVAEKTVKEDAWFFKAHFFQDPVQPGSLGIEAMLQTLQWYMLEEGLDRGMIDPAFEPMATGVTLEWKYRGQVLPRNRKAQVLLQVKEVVQEEQGVLVLAEASLWVDGMKIYEAGHLGMRLADRSFEQLIGLDPEKETWLRDHCPTHTVAAYPFMFMADLIAGRVKREYPDMALTGMSHVQVHRWLVCEAKQKLMVRLEQSGEGLLDATLLVWREASKAKLSRYEPLMTAQVRIAKGYEAPAWAPLVELEQPKEIGSPYSQELLFHGPSMQVMQDLVYGMNGASARIDASSSVIGYGVLHPLLLDALTHGIPHESLDLWSSRALPDTIAYPYQITDVAFYREMPREGLVDVEVRFTGYLNDNVRFPQFEIRVEWNGTPVLRMLLTEIGFPKGKLGRLEPGERKLFLQGKGYVEGACLSEKLEDGSFSLTSEAYKQQNWLPGTLERVYGLPRNLPERDKAKWVAMKELASERLRVHPSAIMVEGSEVYPAASPVHRIACNIQEQGRGFLVRGDEIRRNDSFIREYWREQLHQRDWVMEDLFEGLTRQFIQDYRLDDADACRAMLQQGRPALYLANHQTAIESLLFIYMTAALTGRPLGAIAKKEHRDSWIGQLLAKAGEYPGLPAFIRMFHFDRANQSSMLDLMKDLKRHMLEEGVSMLVHLEGTRALRGGQPVEKISSIFIDLALELELPIVPVRFSGGLPLAPLLERTEFPYGYGGQTVHIGRPIEPSWLKELPYGERTKVILSALNTTGGAVEEDGEPEGDRAFGEKIRLRLEQGEFDEPRAVLQQVLEDLGAPSEETRQVLSRAPAGEHAASDWTRGLTEWLFRKL